MGATQAEADNFLLEDWDNVMPDQADGKYNVFSQSTHVCNWDCFAPDQTMDIP